jgi:opacity protein-like surface antigen
MMFHSARGASLVILLASLTSTAWCQDTRLPGLLPPPPLPRVAGYPVAPATANDALWGQAEPSPVPLVSSIAAATEQTVLGPDYYDAMKGGYNSCTAGAGSCGSPCGGSNCCHNHYVYANALVMNHLKPGGFVTSVDSGTGDQRINFCNREFGNLWAGGLEVGTGWCFGCGCNTALELVYWGIFPATPNVRATDNINSTIDFGDLTYNGASANVPFQNAEFQRVQNSFSFNSVEANLVGNSMAGGPFGCGMCGFCMGRSGSPWGFGYLAGLRYLNFSERFLFSSDPTGFGINGAPQELNYLMQVNNNLFGFQLGTGLSYCVTNRLTAYTIGKFGLYDNHVTGLQRVYGSLGNAVINTGPFAGQGFSVRSTGRESFATAGQFDLGGRWAINNNWSANFGYRVLGITGVATSDVNVHHDQFHDVDGIAVVQRTGSFIIHGAFAGATYCW